jgi:hypothetical protein
MIVSIEIKSVCALSNIASSIVQASITDAGRGQGKSRGGSWRVFWRGGVKSANRVRSDAFSTTGYFSGRSL